MAASTVGASNRLRIAAVVVDPMLKRPWAVETDPDHADFIIATERSRCADNKPVVLIDEVKRFDRTFAWVYARRPQNP